ncbi:MAG: type II secretion system protein GspD [Pirellulales bacterium]
MHTLLRTTVFLLCAITGVVFAICLATSEDQFLSELVQRLPSQQPDLNPSGSTAFNSSADSSKPTTAPQGEASSSGSQHSNPQIDTQIQPASAHLPYQPAYAQQVDLSRIEQSIQRAEQNNDKSWEVVSKAIDSIRDVAEKGFEAQADIAAENAANPGINANPALTNSAESPNPTTSYEPISDVSPPTSLAEIYPGEGDDSLSIVIQDTDISEVLEMISEQGGLNILPSQNVQGNVSASLSKVDIRTALFAILRSTGYEFEELDGFIYVGTQQDMIEKRHASDVIKTKIYRPNYVRASDLQELLTPMLSPEVGQISISAPAQRGIAASSDETGGDDFAGEEVVIIRDYQVQLEKIEKAIIEIDKRPLQVAIEATIMSVQMDDDLDIGVSFEALADQNTVRLTSGFPPATLAALGNEGGLKFGFLDASLTMFVEALESVGDTNIIASPQLLVLNKQKAEILIGEQKGYVSTTVTENASTQSVEFLELGTQLRIRPFIGSDGFIRLEVHPEISTGDVDVEAGFTLPNKEVTQVTTNVMCPDGRTIVIGGLINSIQEQDIIQIPVLGSIPFIGPLFRQTQERTAREELIILITPRIVDPAAIPEDGEKTRDLFELHHSHFADKMSPLGKRHIGRKYYRLATSAWATGDGQSALRYTNLAIHYDPQNLEAVHLRDVVIGQTGLGDKGVHNHLRDGLAPWNHPHGVEVSPWHVDQIQPVYPEELILPGTRIQYQPTLPKDSDQEFQSTFDTSVAN